MVKMSCPDMEIQWIVASLNNTFTVSSVHHLEESAVRADTLKYALPFPCQTSAAPFLPSVTVLNIQFLPKPVEFGTVKGTEDESEGNSNPLT
jgi:hypothetical protein